jgi:hypothetical protein
VTGSHLDTSIVATRSRTIEIASLAGAAIFAVSALACGNVPGA